MDSPAHGVHTVELESMNPTTLGSAAPPAPPHQLAALTELAMDLRWSWNHSMDELWRRLDPELWEHTRHPSVVLQTVTRERLATALADPDFCRLLERLLEVKRQAEATPRWFQERYPQGPPKLRGIFLHGIHVDRGPPDLFRRAR